MTRDERLIAYVDGELSPPDRAGFEAEMAADPALAADVDRHRRLAKDVGDAFDPVLEEPIPARLLTVASAANDPRRRIGPPAWAALAASLVLGVLIGRAVWPLTGPLVADHGALVAQGPIAKALTTQLAADRGVVKVGLSFRTTGGRYCRTFQSTADRLAGLACRDDGRWTVRTVTTWAPQPQGAYRTAGSETPPEVLAAVDKLAAGPALDAAAERAARDKGWR